MMIFNSTVTSVILGLTLSAFILFLAGCHHKYPDCVDGFGVGCKNNVHHYNANVYNDHEGQYVDRALS